MSEKRKNRLELPKSFLGFVSKKDAYDSIRELYGKLEKAEKLLGKNNEKILKMEEELEDKENSLEKMNVKIKEFEKLKAEFNTITNDDLIIQSVIIGTHAENKEEITNVEAYPYYEYLFNTRGKRSPNLEKRSISEYTHDLNRIPVIASRKGEFMRYHLSEIDGYPAALYRTDNMVELVLNPSLRKRIFHLERRLETEYERGLEQGKNMSEKKLNQVIEIKERKIRDLEMIIESKPEYFEYLFDIVAILYALGINIQKYGRSPNLNQFKREVEKVIRIYREGREQLDIFKYIQDILDRGILEIQEGSGRIRFKQYLPDALKDMFNNNRLNDNS